MFEANVIHVDVAPKMGVVNGMEKLFEKVDQIQMDCVDYRRYPIGFEFEDNLDKVLMVIDGQKYVMTDHALSQYLDLLKVGLKMGYVRYALGHNKADNVVYNLKDWAIKPQEYLIRTYKNEVRGFLTEGYNDFQNAEFLEQVSNELSTGESIYTLSSYVLNENRMSVYLTERESFYRDFNLGLKFYNSEVGISSAAIEFAMVTPKRKTNIVFRNGLSQSFVRQPHLGKRDMARKMKPFIENIPVLADELQSKLEIAENRTVDVLEEVNRVAKTINLSQKRTEQFMKRFGTDREMNILDFLEQLTEVGSEFPLLKDRVEVYAGDVLGRVK